MLRVLTVQRDRNMRGIELVASVGNCVCDWIGDYQETVPVTVAVVVLVVSTRRQKDRLVFNRRL